MDKASPEDKPPKPSLTNKSSINKLILMFLQILLFSNKYKLCLHIKFNKLYKI